MVARRFLKKFTDGRRRRSMDGCQVMAMAHMSFWPGDLKTKQMSTTNPANKPGFNSGPT